MPQNQPQPLLNLKQILELIRLMEQYDRRLLSIARQQLNGGPVLLPQEAVHDTYLNYLLNPPDDVRNEFRVLYTILVRRCWKANGRKRLKTSPLDEAFDLPIDVPSARPEADFEFSDLKDRLLNALDKLTPRQRDVLVLKYVQNLNHNQIAEILGISVPAVGRIHRAALERLREILKEGDL